MANTLDRVKATRATADEVKAKGIAATTEELAAVVAEVAANQEALAAWCASIMREPK